MSVNKENPAGLSIWIRRVHRCVAIIFVGIVATIFASLGMGKEPLHWVYYLPLAPLALLMLSGLYMFFLPYVAKRRSGRLTAERSA